MIRARSIQSVPHASGVYLDEPQSALNDDLAYLDYRDFGMVVLRQTSVIREMSIRPKLMVGDSVKSAT
jgi:hypothetical protein